MKLHRILIPVAFGLTAIGLLFGPRWIEPLEPNDARLLTYSLSSDISQALALVCLILYFWTSGTLFAEHRRASIAILLAALVPISVAFGFGIFTNYQAVHQPPDSDHQMIRDHF